MEFFVGVFLALQGEMKGTKEGRDDEVCPRLKSGAYFGELALINNAVQD